MAQKTANLQESVESAQLSDDDASDFQKRLDEFRESLSEREQAILSQMVVDTAGADGEGEQSEPTSEEIHSFMEKLDSFHDELPGDMHLFVDEMLAKTWFKDQAEVQGYAWYGNRIGRGPWDIIPGQQMARYKALCFGVGGDWVRYRHIGGGYYKVACFDRPDY